MKLIILLCLFAGKVGLSQTPDTTVQVSDRQIDTPAYWHTCADETDSLKLQCSEEALLDYLLEQTAQIEAHDSLVNGSLEVQFIVDSTGETTEIAVVRSLNTFCDRKAVEIVRHMPKWISGTEKGKAIKIKYRIPIYFRKK